MNHDARCDRDARTYAIVLAAGEGSRLAPLTHLLYGREIPKQFASVDGERTFVQHTIDRLASIIPPARTVVVVGRSQEGLAREQLGGYDGLEVVLQPANRGTAAGILLPLMHVLARDPGARVAVFPSDHHVRRARPYLAAVRGAFEAAEAAPAGVALVGAAAERAATDLGWIVPGAPIPGGDGRRIEHFVEKPNESVARELQADGGLWNTLVIAAGAQSLWRLVRRHLPEVTRALESYLLHLRDADAAKRLAQIYAQIPSADFSRHVLERAAGLAVVEMRGAGWSDCGTPERLFASLDGTPALPALRARLAARMAPRGAARGHESEPARVGVA
jgi:mannose-1-phosphate guanylyltransferase